MARTDSDRTSLRRAFVLSAALHAVMLPLLLALLAAPSATDEIVVALQRSTRVQPMSIEHRVFVAHVAPHAAVLRPASEPARVASLRPSAAQPAKPQPVPHRVDVALPATVAVTAGSSLRPIAKTTTSPGSPPKTVAIATRNDAAALPSAVRAAPASGLAVAAPVATPPAALATPSPVATATSAAETADSVPVGGWGQSFERAMVADESALADLRKRYALGASVSVTVDESGRAVRVNTPGAIPAGVREELLRELLALRYVPAECNGLRCAGTAEVEL